MSHAFIEENTKQRERLRTLVARLSDEELTHPLYGELTVAGIFGHLAFWDTRALLAIKKWKETGTKPSSLDADTINDAMQPILLAIPPRQAAGIALAAAAAIDTEIEGLNSDQISEVEANLPALRLDRGRHRGAHINDIEAVLSLKK